MESPQPRFGVLLAAQSDLTGTSPTQRYATATAARSALWETYSAARLTGWVVVLTSDGWREVGPRGRSVADLLRAARDYATRADAPHPRWAHH